MPRRKVLDEEDLEYWADLFIREEFARYIPFRVFISNPRRYQDQILGEEFRPLLAIQKEVAARIDPEPFNCPRLQAACDGLEAALGRLERSITNLGTNNGRYYERLKHHRVAG